MCWPVVLELEHQSLFLSFQSCHNFLALPSLYIDTYVELCAYILRVDIYVYIYIYMHK